MKVSIMRHGPAEERAASGRDVDRVLTFAGRERTLRVARGLVRLGDRPARIVSSPLSRAQETAAIVARVLGEEPAPEVTEELGPGGDSLGLVRSLLAGGEEHVLLVGHEPDVSGLVAALSSSWRGHFEPAQLVALEVTRGSASERFVIAPRTLGD